MPPSSISRTRTSRRGWRITPTTALCRACGNKGLANESLMPSISVGQGHVQASAGAGNAVTTDPMDINTVMGSFSNKNLTQTYTAKNALSQSVRVGDNSGRTVTVDDAIRQSHSTNESLTQAIGRAVTRSNASGQDFGRDQSSEKAEMLQLLSELGFDHQIKAGGGAKNTSHTANTFQMGAGVKGQGTLGTPGFLGSGVQATGLAGVD